jgi:hypothetical protein
MEGPSTGEPFCHICGSVSKADGKGSLRYLRRCTGVQFGTQLAAAVDSYECGQADYKNGRTTEQPIVPALLESGLGGRKTRNRFYHCPHGAEGVRNFHSSCATGDAGSAFNCKSVIWKDGTPEINESAVQDGLCRLCYQSQTGRVRKVKSSKCVRWKCVGC